MSQPEPFLRRVLARLGAWVMDGASAAGELAGVAAGAFRGMLRGPRPSGQRHAEVVHQMYLIGNQSLLFIAVTLAFVGMVLVYQSCLQAQRVLGDLSILGPELAKLFVHEFGPTLTGVMLATRVGAGIAAEIGSMKVTEQLDALRMCGVSPIEYLIVPRMLASMVMTVALALFGIVVAYGAGGLTAWASFEVNPRSFFVLDYVTFTHLGIGLVKALAYGISIPIIAGFCGLRARGSSEGVGWATTAAVIGCSLAVIVLDFLLSAVGYLLLASEI